MTSLPGAAFEVPSEDSAFWAGTARGVLLLPHCGDCGFSWYPRPFCPACGGVVERVPATGAGTVYSYTIVRKARGAFRELTPYVVAYVELAEGPRILSNIIDCDPERIRVGLPVRLVFDEPGDDPEAPRLFRFKPAPAG